MVDDNHYCPRQASAHTIYQAQYSTEPVAYYDAYPLPTNAPDHPSNPFVQHHGMNNALADMYFVPVNECSGSDQVPLKPMTTTGLEDERHSCSQRSSEKAKVSRQKPRRKKNKDRDGKKYEILRKPKLSSYEDFPVLSVKPKQNRSHLDQACKKNPCKNKDNSGMLGQQEHVPNYQEKELCARRRGKTKEETPPSRKLDDETKPKSTSSAKKHRSKTPAKTKPSRQK